MSTLLRHEPVLDTDAIRADFPILHQEQPGGRKSLVFLDSASSSQKPQQVIDAISSFYETSNSNIHRGVYHLSEAATGLYEDARQTLASFIGAADPREVIFVRNTTEAINLVAASWGRANLKSGDLILLTEMEHHSNLVPWHLIAEQTGARIEAIPLNDMLELDMGAYHRLLEQKPRVVAFAHVQNSIGVITDVKGMTKAAHDAGAIVVIDGAQSAPHLAIDVQELDVDFFALSGHKMVGPLGSGVLYGKAKHLEAMPPFMGGGGMIRKVNVDSSTYADIPARFEAGTPAVADAVGLAAAAKYLQGIGLDAIHRHELDLTGYAIERLDAIPNVRKFHPADREVQSGVLSFEIEGIHPHDVAALLDEDNVAVRAGHHCNQPLMERLGVNATTRASFYLYNTRSDVDRLADSIERAKTVFGV